MSPRYNFMDSNNIVETYSSDFSASSFAVEVLPDPDGPSIAITIYTPFSKSQVIYNNI